MRVLNLLDKYEPYGIFQNPVSFADKFYSLYLHFKPLHNMLCSLSYLLTILSGVIFK